MLEFSFNPFGYSEHKSGDALEAKAAESFFNFFFKMLSISSDVSVSRRQCDTQRWGNVCHLFFGNVRLTLTVRTDGILSSKTQHI